MSGAILNHTLLSTLVYQFRSGDWIPYFMWLVIIAGFVALFLEILSKLQARLAERKLFREAMSDLKRVQQEANVKINPYREKLLRKELLSRIREEVSHVKMEKIVGDQRKELRDLVRDLAKGRFG